MSVSPGENTGSSDGEMATSVHCTGGSKSVIRGSSDGKDGWMDFASGQGGRALRELQLQVSRVWVYGIELSV